MDFLWGLCFLGQTLNFSYEFGISIMTLILVPNPCSQSLCGMLGRPEIAVIPALAPSDTLTLKGYFLKGASLLSLSTFPKLLFVITGGLRINPPPSQLGTGAAFLPFAGAPGEPTCRTQFWRNLRKEDPPGINEGHSLQLSPTKV